MFEEVREKLIQDKKRIESEIEERLNWLQGRGKEIDEVLEKQYLLQDRELSRLLKFVKKIENTLLSMNKKNFGICESCECHISKERLLARPVTKLCLDCQEIKEGLEKHNIHHRRDLKKIMQQSVFVSV